MIYVDCNIVYGFNIVVVLCYVNTVVIDFIFKKINLLSKK